MGPVFENLSDAIFHFSQARPDAPAIHEGTGTITYRDLAGLVGRAAVHLRDLGVKPGELVGISLPTSTAHVILLYAAMRIGAVAVDIPMRRPAEWDPFKQFGVKRVLTVPGVTIADATVHAIDASWKASIASKT
jgi:acyl-CoA synthetase (AMP-forming)/AMP-acid ligase II